MRSNVLLSKCEEDAVIRRMCDYANGKNKIVPHFLCLMVKDVN